MSDHALDVLREVHAETGSDVPFPLVQKVYELERAHQYDEDPQVRHSAVRVLVTLAVDEMMKGPDAEPDPR